MPRTHDKNHLLSQLWKATSARRRVKELESPPVEIVVQDARPVDSVAQTIPLQKLEHLNSTLQRTTRNWKDISLEKLEVWRIKASQGDTEPFRKRVTCLLRAKVNLRAVSDQSSNLLQVCFLKDVTVYGH